MWTSKRYLHFFISFTLKWHYCHVQFVDIQHNFEITYLHLNYNGCRSSHQKCSIKELFLKILQYTRKTPALESLWNNFADLSPATFLKKRFQHRYFSVNIFNNICEMLLLRVSCWNFATTKFVICNLNFSFAILQRQSFDFVNTRFILSFYLKIPKFSILKYCCPQFNCEIKFLPTSSYQTNLQNFSSPLHLSVLQHLPIIKSHLFLYRCLLLCYFTYRF